MLLDQFQHDPGEFDGALGIVWPALVIFVAFFAAAFADILFDFTESALSEYRQILAIGLPKALELGLVKPFQLRRYVVGGRVGDPLELGLTPRGDLGFAPDRSLRRKQLLQRKSEPSCTTRRTWESSS